MKSSHIVQDLLRMLANTEEQELTCEQCFAFLDYYVELEAAGADVERILPEVAQHLRVCTDCEEEYRALLQVIGAEHLADL